MSTSPVTGKLPRIATRHSQITVAIVKHGETPIILGGYCKEEIYIFWQNNIHLSNFRNCFVFHKPLEATFSDASDTACGAVTYIKGGEHAGQKMWTQDQRGRSSIWRELSAIEFLLLLRLLILCMAHVRWYSDNQVTAKIVEVGSMRFEWHTPALKVFIISYEHSIHLDTEWVLRDCNTRANVISKLIDFDDRQVTEDVFQRLG